jgi:hypothetical protein
MMEYKQDRRTGECVLMEVNGRFWGSLELAVAAGVDFPFLAFQLARGLTPEMAPPYRAGVKNRWLLGDLDHMLLRLFRSAEALDLPSGAPSTMRTLGDFLKIAQPGLHYEVVNGTDWAPFACELQQYLREIGRMVVPTHRPRVATGRPARTLTAGGTPAGTAVEP